jgi:hypothetical protein
MNLLRILVLYADIKEGSVLIEKNNIYRSFFSIFAHTLCIGGT